MRTLLITELFNIVKHLTRLTLTVYPTVHHNISPVSLKIIQDKTCVRDDKSGFFPMPVAPFFLQQTGNNRPHHLQVFQINP